MPADVLSDVLRTVRLTGAAFFDVAAAAPWVAEQPPREMILPKILPGAGHLIAYHLITEGHCFANLVGGEPIGLAAGEIIVFTKADPHVMASSPGMRADPVAPGALNAATGSQLPFLLNYGSDGPVSAKLICGWLACDAHPFNPLLDSLPPVIKAEGLKGGATPWLGEVMRLAITESANRRPGGETVLARLSELLFIEVVRRHLEALPKEQAGWLAGLRDPFVSKALALMHGAPAQNWTIEELGKKVGLSRSLLAERFADLVGMPSMLYLAKWRMQIAAGLLSSSNAGIAAIADATGYGSEAAFSRVFKKLVGMPPSAWRGRLTSSPSLIQPIEQNPASQTSRRRLSASVRDQKITP
jgi:AraC-like DNA-binding protein